jgi:hypothetical protein
VTGAGSFTNTVATIVGPTLATDAGVRVVAGTVLARVAVVVDDVLFIVVDVVVGETVVGNVSGFSTRIPIGSILTEGEAESSARTAALPAQPESTTATDTLNATIFRQTPIHTTTLRTHLILDLILEFTVMALSTSHEVINS